MGYKVLFSCAILAAVIALGSSCLDCDCLQCQSNPGEQPTLPTLPNLPNPVMSLQQLLDQVRMRNRQLLRGLYNTKSNVLNTGLGVANSALDTAFNTKQQALNLAMNPLSGEGISGLLSTKQNLLTSVKSGAADLVSNTLQTKGNLINSLLPGSGGSSISCDCSNCIQKDSSTPRRPCKKPMPKLYLPRPTFTYVINATSLPQFQSKYKPRSQLVKTVETVRTYVQQEPSEDEDCEYDTENIQYEFIDDDQAKDNVNIQFIKPPTYEKVIPTAYEKVIPTTYEKVIPPPPQDKFEDIEDSEVEIKKFIEEDIDFEEKDIDSETLDEEININIDDETKETLLDTDVDEPIVKRISRTKKDQDYEYCDCEDDEDYDIAIRVIRPKNMKGRPRKCKCRKNRPHY